MENNLFRPLLPISEEGSVDTRICFYHISEHMLPNDHEFIPRLPYCVGDKDDYIKYSEDAFIPRISISRSIEGALKSKTNYYMSEQKFYVYKIPYNPKIMSVVEPTIRAVHDGLICNELWLLTPLKPHEYELVGIITDIRLIYPSYKSVEYSTRIEDFAIGTNQCYFPEIYYTYIPYKIIKSPFIHVDQDNDNKEYQYYKNRRPLGGGCDCTIPDNYKDDRERFELDGVHKYYKRSSRLLIH